MPMPWDLSSQGLGPTNGRQLLSGSNVTRRKLDGEAGQNGRLEVHHGPVLLSVGVGAATGASGFTAAVRCRRA